MLELKKNTLVFSFPEVHRDAVLRVEFQRTLRIPDDGKEYPLPPGLGSFPLQHVDDHAARVSDRWLDRGGVMLPMYQSEALWLNFMGSYPFAVKVAAGKINAVTGEAWQDGLSRNPQDYMVVPEQPWLDGYCVEKGVIRQFVAMPLGAGYSAEEQISGKAEFGGIQIVAYPMTAEKYEELHRRQKKSMRFPQESDMDCLCEEEAAGADMALAPGGKMQQEIYDDPHGIHAWERSSKNRCFVHLANSLMWRAITDQEPPTTPVTAKAYTQAGMPWFDFYNEDAKAVPGSKVLSKLKSVVTMGKEKGDVPLPENASVKVTKIQKLRKGMTKSQIRDGDF